MVCTRQDQVEHLFCTCEKRFRNCEENDQSSGASCGFFPGTNLLHLTGAARFDPVHQSNPLVQEVASMVPCILAMTL